MAAVRRLLTRCRSRARRAGPASRDLPGRHRAFTQTCSSDQLPRPTPRCCGPAIGLGMARLDCTVFYAVLAVAVASAACGWSKSSLAPGSISRRTRICTAAARSGIVRISADSLLMMAAMRTWRAALRGTVVLGRAEPMVAHLGYVSVVLHGRGCFEGSSGSTRALSTTARTS